MKKKCVSVLSAILLSSVFLFAQTDKSVVEDFKPASTNQPGKDYPMVNSEGRVRARISAPEAQRVQ
ncbi:MAG: esterase, partial [Dysgonamonadaceae bacterium]